MNEELFSTYVSNDHRILSISIYDNQKLDLNENTFIKNDNPITTQDLTLDPKLIKFYSVIKKWKFKWETNKNCDFELEGTFNIRPLDVVLIGDTDFLPEQFPVMKNFTLLDHFYNEAAVGLYLDKPEEGLFYFEFDAAPQKLYLDFKGYMEMLKYTKGVCYWQYIILQSCSGISERIIQNMNKLFPEFTEKGFFELYNSVRIN